MSQQRARGLSEKLGLALQVNTLPFGQFVELDGAHLEDLFELVSAEVALQMLSEAFQLENT